MDFLTIIIIRREYVSHSTWPRVGTSVGRKWSMDTSSEDGENDDKCDSSFTSKTELSVEEAFRLLTTNDDTVTIIAAPPVRPKAGQVFSV